MRTCPASSPRMKLKKIKKVDGMACSRYRDLVGRGTQAPPPPAVQTYIYYRYIQFPPPPPPRYNERQNLVFFVQYSANFVTAGQIFGLWTPCKSQEIPFVTAEDSIRLGSL